MRTRLISLTFLLLASACGNADDAPRQQRGTTSAQDTTDLQQVYADLDQLQDVLIKRYRQRVGDLPADASGLYEHMLGMHANASQMHEGMMAGMHGPGMMGRDMMHGGGMMDVARTREWDQQMLAMHQQMSSYFAQQGMNDMAELHGQMADAFGRAMRGLPATGVQEEREAGTEDAASPEALFSQHCAGCHGADGQGMAGVFPPLSGSDWVTGEPATLARIVLHGLAGPIVVNGEDYEGTMPAFGARLTDAEIASLLTYIRTSWENEAGRIQAADVRAVRREHRERAEPWNVSALR